MTRCLVLAATLYATPAVADDSRGTTNATEYRFDDDLVLGDLVEPTGEILRSRRHGPRESLVRIRDQFIAELLKSVERL